MKAFPSPPNNLPPPLTLARLLPSLQQHPRPLRVISSPSATTMSALRLQVTAI